MPILNSDFNISDQVTQIAEQTLDSPEQIFAFGSDVQPPQNAAGHIVGAMLEPNKYEKATFSGLSEEI